MHERLTSFLPTQSLLQRKSFIDFIYWNKIKMDVGVELRVPVARVSMKGLLCFPKSA